MRMRTIAFLMSLVLADAANAGEAAVRVGYRQGTLPTVSADAAWASAPRAELDLMGQIIIPPHGGGSVGKLSVRGLHNGQWLALHLEWADATVNRQVGVNRFRDAVAVAFPMRQSDPLPSPFMGDEHNPVDVWQWTADFDANAKGGGEFAESYPHTDGVWYFPHDYDVQRRVTAWRGSTPVIDYVAHGFGSLARKSTQNVRGLGRHQKGRWQVVLVRQLSTGNSEDILFRAGEVTHAVFAVWDGEKGEVNGKKSITITWVPFALDAADVAAR